MPFKPIRLDAAGLLTVAFWNGPRSIRTRRCCSSRCTVMSRRMPAEQPFGPVDVTRDHSLTLLPGHWAFHPRVSSLRDLPHQQNGIFMILKTYTRMFTTDLESTVATLEAVHSCPPHLRLNYPPLTLVGIGDVLVIGGTDEALEPIRGSFGPWIVENIEVAKDKLLSNGASVMRDIKDIPTGQMMYMKHADGSVVEYVEWAPELVEQHILAPLRAGTPASQI